MKHRILLSLGVAALLPAAMAHAQATGKIHGRVTDPTGIPETKGAVSLSNDNGVTLKYTFPVNGTGDFTGDNIAPGTYTLVFRTPDMPPGKIADQIDSVKIEAGQDTAQDDDLSRPAYIEKLPADQQKQIAEFKKKNADIVKSNQMVGVLNADIKQAQADVRAGDQAHATAVAALGATASKTDLAAKETEIRKEKYGEAETLMTKDTGLRPDAALLWQWLGDAQSGLGKFDAAETSYKKGLQLNASAKKPDPIIEGSCQAGLGAVYVQTKKIPEATAAYDAAAKVLPAQAPIYYSNFAKLLYRLNSTGAATEPDAQAAAADKAITATPASNSPAYALLFYLKAQALTQKATFDEKTQKITLPPGTAEAYQKYLDLDPNGPFANDAKQVLASAGQKVESKFKAKK